MAISGENSTGTLSVRVALGRRDQHAATSGNRPKRPPAETIMNSIIYIVGLIVVVLVILSFLGLR
jgi:hypothetical protein